MPCVSVKHIRDTRATLKAAKSQLTRPAVAAKPNARTGLFARLRHSLRTLSSKKNPLPQAPVIESDTSSTPVQNSVHTTKIAEGFIKIPHERARRIVPTSDPVRQVPLASSAQISAATQNTPSATSRRHDRLSTFTQFRLSGRRSRADLINAESHLGSQIFGPIPEGHRREFFHDRENIWIWHEDWTDQSAQPRQLTVRYEVRPSGVYKKISAGNYFRLEGYELENFRRAAHLYLALVKTHLYSQTTTNA